MSDPEIIELALRRVSSSYAEIGTHDTDLIANALERVADELLELIKIHRHE
jgi:hypothetical protein